MKTILIGITLTYSFFSFAQDQETKQFKNDIAISGGISLENQTFGRYSLIYRRDISESWKLSFSGNFDKSFSSMDNNYNPLFASDSMIILRRHQTLSHRYILKTGIEKTFFKIFYVGAHVNIGYDTRKNITIDKGQKFNSDVQEWQNCNECVYAYHNIDPDEYYKVDPSQTLGHPDYVRINKGTEYLVYGLSLNVGMQYPISNRWALALQYSPELLRYQPLDNGVSSNKFRHYTDLILRFKI
jgi:hypothetical protein